MNWELFVDESGDFEPNKPCLVGGFLCPAGTMNEEIAASWKYDISHDAAIEEAITNFGNWQFDHCCKNRTQTNQKKINRGIIQTKVVEAYIQKLEGIGGKLIIFDNPSGSFNIDNTTNFLTVLAKGLMMLFYDLQDELTSIKVHFASRRNNTRQDSPEELAISPTKVQEFGMSDSGTILPVQYAAVLRNLAFLQGGSQLLNNPVFNKMISTIDIIEDQHIRVDYDAPFILNNG